MVNKKYDNPLDEVVSSTLLGSPDFIAFVKDSTVLSSPKFLNNNPITH